MKCFVIMPFGDPAVDAEGARRQELIYSQWIKPAVEAVEVPGAGGARILCHRADKESRPGEIIAHVIRNLAEADIVIADLSGRSPNVFYELGVRHAVSNNTILLAQDVKDIPFDLNGQRTIVYRYDPEHMLNLRERLGDAVRAILESPKQIDNPVAGYFQNRKLDRVLEGVLPGHDAIRNMLAEVSSLRGELTTYVEEVRRITRSVTSSPEMAVAAGEADERETSNLEPFEGVWRRWDNSTYCMRVVTGALHIAYCYGDDTHLTGHVYNCRVIGETLFGRFEWFGADISGYMFYTLKPGDQLVGGWWYAEDLPLEVSRDLSRIGESMPGMNKSVLRKDNVRTLFPEWAEEYFTELKTGTISNWFRQRAGVVARKLSR